MISEFQGQYRFLSNFWPAVVQLDGIYYPTVEHAYQAAKTLQPIWRLYVGSALDLGTAKARGGCCWRLLATGAFQEMIALLGESIS